MGFYGNITNTARTNFHFDRIYANRFEMEENMVNDSIYLGRFVLIEYDTNASNENFKRIYINSQKVNGFYYGYTSKNHELHSRIIVGKAGQQFTTESGLTYTVSAKIGDTYWDLNPNTKLKDFYKVVGKDNSGYAYFSKVNLEYAYDESEPARASNYIINYNIDKNAYGEDFNGRGYDSTVWQKVFVNDEERYVLVAELNSSVPTFDITADAPTMNPITPHFDINSTDMYYKLHVQPQWGFRIAAAEEDGPSDEMTAWGKTVYDPKTNKNSYYYWNGKSWVETKNIQAAKEIPAAIYYNKAGFDREIETITSEDMIDLISIKPTGKSGMKYSNHDEDGTTSEQIDTQELSVILPSLGNTIAEVWNIIYGPGESDEEEEPKKRNLDIDWGSTEGHRLSLEKDGYAFKPEQVATVAGCINSVHDLMGMIITDDIPEEIDKVSTECIYFNEKTKEYLYKTERYEFKDDPAPNYTFEKVDITKEEYIGDTYYLDAQGNTTDTSNSFNPNLTYYERHLNNAWIETLPMYNYEAGKFYYKRGDDYLIENNIIPYDERKYFIINGVADPLSFKAEYIPGQYFYKNGDKWIKAIENKPLEDTIYYTIKIESEKGYPWVPDNYYIEPEPGHFEKAMEYDETASYFIFTSEGSKGNLYYTFREVDVFLVEGGNYYIAEYDGTKPEHIAYAPVDKADKDISISYYIITPEEQTYTIEDFFVQGNYYKKTNNSYYFLGSNSEFDPEILYYTLTEENITQIQFFKPNTYYVEFNAEKIIAESFIAGEKYYTLGETFHVKEDSRRIYGTGEKWNNQVKLVPWTVELAYLDNITPILKPLEGFAKNFNTIHGLILRLNHILGEGNPHTRDTSTAQGVINTINDIIFKFEAIIPKKFLTVGHTGKIYSTSWTTAQEHNGTIAENEWINLDLNERLHRITLTHESHLTEKESYKEPYGVQKYSLDFSSGENAYNREVFIPSFRFDECGHIMSAVDTRMIMPTSFNKIYLPNNDEIVADTIISSLELANDKWIKIEKLDENKLGIGHGISLDSKLDLNLNNIPLIVSKFDECGHILELSDNGTGLMVNEKHLGNTIASLEEELKIADKKIEGLESYLFQIIDAILLEHPDANLPEYIPGGYQMLTSIDKEKIKVKAVDEETGEVIEGQYIKFLSQFEE